MIDYDIRRIGIFVFNNRFFFSVFAIKFLCNFINFHKIDRFRKITSTKRNQIDSFIRGFTGGRVGSFIDLLQLIVSTLRVQLIITSNAQVELHWGRGSGGIGPPSESTIRSRTLPEFEGFWLHSNDKNERFGRVENAVCHIEFFVFR